MSKKPSKKLDINNGQKGIRSCKECGKLDIVNWEDASNDDFCSQECKDHYEAEEKPQVDKSILDGSKDVIMESNSDKDDNEEHHHL